jgi:hypothetical protein
MYCRMKYANMPKGSGEKVTLQVVTAYLTTFLWIFWAKPWKSSFRISCLLEKIWTWYLQNVKCGLLSTFVYMDTFFHVLIYLMFEIKLYIKISAKTHSKFVVFTDCRNLVCICTYFLFFQHLELTNIALVFTSFVVIPLFTPSLHNSFFPGNAAFDSRPSESQAQPFL